MFESFDDTYFFGELGELLCLSKMLFIPPIMLLTCWQLA